MVVVKLLAANQHPVGHGVSKYLLFSFLISHLCHFKSVQNTAANIISAPTTLRSSLFPQPPLCGLGSLPRSFTKPCLGVSCSFLQPRWGTWGCPSSGLQARHSHLAADTRALIQNPGLCKTCAHLSLCSLLSSIASMHTGTLLASLSYQPSCRLLPKIWDMPTAAAPLPHKPSWKFSKQGSRLFYCFLHPTLWK